MTTGPMAASAHLVHLATSVPWYISPGDTVKLAPLAEPTQTHGASVFLEVWEPGGAQPLNSHPHATETFLFLAGQGIAISDGTQVAVRAEVICSSCLQGPSTEFSTQARGGCARSPP